jgi:hypothetical protein
MQWAIGGTWHLHVVHLSSVLFAKTSPTFIASFPNWHFKALLLSETTVLVFSFLASSSLSVAKKEEKVSFLEHEPPDGHLTASPRNRTTWGVAKIDGDAAVAQLVSVEDFNVAHNFPAKLVINDCTVVEPFLADARVTRSLLRVYALSF